MKKFFIFIGALLSISGCMAPESTHSEKSWWDTGVDILQNLNNGGEMASLKGPSSGELRDAFKQALSIGTENVIKKVGIIDGFNRDPSIHIPLPEDLITIKTMLSKVGMSQPVDDLELKLNRAAESAAPKAKDLFLEAIAEMTFDDIRDIYEGPEDSATKYFQKKMTPNLKKEMRPIIQNTLSQVGAIRAYDNVMGRYKSLPFVPDVNADIEDYTIDKGIEGIFYYMAKEEAGIRRDPAKQTTALLKKVFGVK